MVRVKCNILTSVSLIHCVGHSPSRSQPPVYQVEVSGEGLRGSVRRVCAQNTVCLDLDKRVGRWDELTCQKSETKNLLRWRRSGSPTIPLSYSSPFRGRCLGPVILRKPIPTCPWPLCFCTVCSGDGNSSSGNSHLLLDVIRKVLTVKK